MIVTSKNGVRLDICPKRWWHPLDVLEFIKTVWQIRNTNVHFNPNDWRIAQFICCINEEV